MGSKKRKYKPKDTLSVKITVDTDKKTLDWINSQKNISNSILDIIKRYANNKLLPIEAVNQMLMFPNVRKENDIEKKKNNTEDIDRNTEKLPENSGLDNANIIKEKEIGGSEKIDIKKSKETKGKKKESAIIIPDKKLPFEPIEITKKLSNIND